MEKELKLIAHFKRNEHLWKVWQENRVNSETELVLFSPIILLPRILGGILYSYLRLNSGIVIAICFHSFNNGIFKIIGMIAN